MTDAGTYYATNYTASFVTVPPTLVHASKQGKLMVLHDRCLLTTNLGVGTVMNFFKPPKGSRLVGGTLYAEAMLTSTTLSVGTSVQSYDRKTDIRDVDYDDAAGAEALDADRFLAATAANAAAKTDFPDIGNILALGYEFDGDTIITVTSAGAELVTAKYVALKVELVLP